MYILKLSDNEYIEKFSLNNGEVWTTDNKSKAMRFNDYFGAVFHADKFACDVEEIKLMSKEIEDAIYETMNEHARTVAKHLTNMYGTLKITEKCPKCNGEGFLIVEDIEYAIKECSTCKGEGVGE